MNVTIIIFTDENHFILFNDFYSRIKKQLYFLSIYLSQEKTYVNRINF